jgi:hypothetical protein
MYQKVSISASLCLFLVSVEPIKYFKGKHCRYLFSAKLGIFFSSFNLYILFIMGASGLGPTVLAVTWSEFAAGTVLMALRIYTNGFILRRWNPDFWWAFVSYVSIYLCF